MFIGHHPPFETRGHLIIGKSHPTSCSIIQGKNRICISARTRSCRCCYRNCGNFRLIEVGGIKRKIFVNCGESIYKKSSWRWEILNMTDEVNTFYGGMVAGIKLYRKKVVLAHRNHEPIRIDGELYYIQNAKERLQDMIDKVWK